MVKTLSATETKSREADIESLYKHRLCMCVCMVVVVCV